MVAQKKQRICNRNELMQGPSPQVLKAVRQGPLEDINTYPDGYYNSGSLLEQTLCKRFNLPQSRLLVTYGVEPFLGSAFDWLARIKGSLLTHQYCYGYYRTGTAERNVAMHTFAMPEVGNTFSFDVADFLAKYRQHKPKLLILTSPNNPTGNVMEMKSLLEILDETSPGTLVILDEAYDGFENGTSQTATLGLLEKYPNLAISRTFSKYYGLAGLRLGFILCGTNVIELMNYPRPYLGINRVSQAAALAALNSTAYYQKTAQQVIAERTRIIQQLRTCKSFKVYQSSTNFVLLRALLPTTHQAIEAGLHKFKILQLKHMGETLWRFSIGTKAVNTVTLKFLKSL